MSDLPRAWDLMRIWIVYERSPLCDRKAAALEPIVAKFAAIYGDDYFEDAKFLHFALAQLPLRAVRKFRNEIAAEIHLRAGASIQSCRELLTHRCQA